MSLPFAAFEGEVKPEWIDGNGHMNLAYYLVLFDHALDLLCAEWDLDWAYTQRTEMGMFAVETHTLYEQELVLGDRVRVHSWALAADAKRVHVAQEMFRLPDMAKASCWEADDAACRPDAAEGGALAGAAAQPDRHDGGGACGARTAGLGGAQGGDAGLIGLAFVLAARSATLGWAPRSCCGRWRSPESIGTGRCSRDSWSVIA